MFCQYCGKKLEDGQLCDCPESQNDSLNELDAEDITMMNQEYPENQENSNHKSLTKSMVKTLFQEVSGYVRTYLKSPPQAIAQAVEICNIKIAVVLSILTALSTGLAIFGIFNNLRNSFIDVAKGVITRYFGSLLNVDELITLNIFDFLWWGALIAIFYIFVYCILYYFMAKVLINDISLKGIYMGCSINTVVPAGLIFVSFLLSFVSVPLALLAMFIATMSIPVLGVIPAQYYCKNAKDGKFWLIYLLGLVIISVASYYVLPKLIWKAVGTIQLCNPTNQITVSLKTLFDAVPKDTFLKDFSWKAVFEEIVEDIVYELV